MKPFLIGLWSLWAWVIWATMLVVFGLPLAILALVLPLGWFLRLLKVFSRLALALAGIRVVARGLNAIDWSGHYVVMGNHVNLLEPFVFVSIIPKHMVGIEKRENHRIPIYGAISRRWGMIAIDRSNPHQARASIQEAADRLRQGSSIIILPEGTRSKDGHLGTFKKGGFHLAIQTGASIVPFAFNGGYRVLRTGDWRVRPGTIEVTFGEPISTEDYSPETLPDLIARVRRAIASLYRGPTG